MVRGAKTIKKKKGKGRRRGEEKKGKREEDFSFGCSSKSLQGDRPCLDGGSHGLSYRLSYLTKKHTLAFLSYIEIVSSCSREIQATMEEGLHSVTYPLAQGN